VVRNGENAPDIYARLLLAWAQRREARSGVPVAESLRRFRVRAGGDWTRGRPENGAEGFFQPLNEGVDLEREIPITSIERSAPHRSLKEIRSYIQSNVAGTILERFKSGVINKDTGFVITMSKSDLGEHLKSDAASVNIRDQFEAICALPELMERALLVESHPDSHQRPEVKCVHRFYAPLQIADAMYAVKLTVNEFVDGHLSVDFPSSLKLYHHRLEKKMPSVDMPGFPLNGVTTGQTEGTFNISLRQLLEDVKDSEGNVFFVADNALHQKDPGRLRQNNVTYPDTSLKEAYEQAREAYSKKSFEIANGTMIRVSTDGLKETTSKHAPKEHIAILGALPEVLKNTYIFRKEKSTDKTGRTMHGIAAVVIDGEPMLVRSTFKQVLEKGTPFWKYYGSRIMKAIKKEGTPVTQVLQESADSKPILHVPSLGNTLYDWIQAVNDSGKRFPEDRTLLYQGEDFAAPRGSITPVDEGYLIRLYDKADLSTMLHETGHFFLLEMEQDIRAGIADASTIKDLAAIRRWLGAQGDAPLTRAQHEAFARGFERYLREGKAPSRELESIFARFRQWLVHLYRKATSLDVKLNDDVRAVFNRMLTAEQDGVDFSSVKSEQSAVVSARFKSKDEFFLQRDGKAPESTLFQPVNSGVDPDLKITALPVMEETGNTWEYTKGKGRRDIINTITGILKNDYTSKEYELTRPGAEHLINSALRRGLGGLPHIAAVRNIHNLFNISIPVEIHADRKNQQDVSKMHHFFEPMLYREKAAESIYAVHILVKEYDGERRVELAGVQKLYDLQLEKKMPVKHIDARPYHTAGGHATQQASFQIPLRQLLEGVNDSEGVPYFPENNSF